MATYVSGQVVYLTCDQTRLYVEIIQVLEDRQLGWVRPLMLVTPARPPLVHSTGVLGTGAPADRPEVPDMLWPLGQFYPALDTDVVSCLTPPSAQAATVTAAALTSASLNCFIQRLWGQAQFSSQTDDEPRA